MEDLIATEGACGMDDCQPYWISYQVLSVIAASILGSTLIGKLIITLRTVLPQDKCSAIAFEIFFISLFVFVPGKFGYRFIAGLKIKLIVVSSSNKIDRYFQIALVNTGRPMDLDAFCTSRQTMEII
jgi:hypothetical protein